jgi:hypothetical protein
MSFRTFIAEMAVLNNITKSSSTKKDMYSEFNSERKHYKELTYNGHIFFIRKTTKGMSIIVDPDEKSSGMVEFDFINKLPQIKMIASYGIKGFYELLVDFILRKLKYKKILGDTSMSRDFLNANTALNAKGIYNFSVFDYFSNDEVTYSDEALFNSSLNYVVISLK